MLQVGSEKLVAIPPVNLVFFPIVITTCLYIASCCIASRHQGRKRGGVKLNNYYVYMKTTLKNKVEHCLKKYAETRNSDLRLTQAIWWEFHRDELKEIEGVVYVKVGAIMDLPREDQISRVRRKFQESGKYLPTDRAVVIKRKINEMEWREYMATHKY